MYGVSYNIPYITERNKMENNTTFKITYTKLNGESVTRKGKWTDKCREFATNAGHKCLTYFDLGANNYRQATDKITAWSIGIFR